MSNYNPRQGMNPCPICGVPGEVYRAGGSSSWGVSHDVEACPIGGWGFITHAFPSREAAALAWNTLKTVTIPSCILPRLNGEKSE